MFIKSVVGKEDARKNRIQGSKINLRLTEEEPVNRLHKYELAKYPDVSVSRRQIRAEQTRTDSEVAIGCS